MKMLTFLSFLCLILLVSCSDDDSTTNPTTGTVIQPFAVGNIWHFESELPIIGTQKMYNKITSQKTLKYEGKDVIVYHMDSDVSSTQGTQNVFIYNDYIYIANTMTDTEVTSASENFPYKYKGQKQIKFMGKTYSVSNDMRVFQDKEVSVLKLKTSDNSSIMYFKLGVGMIESITTYQSTSVTIKMTDYTLN